MTSIKLVVCILLLSIVYAQVLSQEELIQTIRTEGPQSKVYGLDRFNRRFVKCSFFDSFNATYAGNSINHRCYENSSGPTACTFSFDSQSNRIIQGCDNVGIECEKTCEIGKGIDSSLFECCCTTTLCNSNVQKILAPILQGNPMRGFNQLPAV